jgi:DNA-binding NtrC family response regulator
MNFIPKPFTLNELVDSVAEVLKELPKTAARRPDQAAGQ